jgi:hypothetical protein
MPGSRPHPGTAPAAIQAKRRRHRGPIRDGRIGSSPPAGRLPGAVQAGMAESALYHGAVAQAEEELAAGRSSQQDDRASGQMLACSGRREDPVALGHELMDLLPVRVAGEQHPDAITAGSLGEERAASGQQRLAFVWVGTQHEQRDGLAGRALPCHEQAERPPPDVERLRPAVDPHRHLGQRQA